MIYGTFNNLDMNKEIWKLVFIGFFLSISITLIPPIGILISSLTPLPLILIYYVFGMRMGLLATGMTALLLTALSGFHFGLVFLIQYGLMGLIIGESFRREYSMEKTLVAATVGPLAVGLLILAVYWLGSELNFAGNIEKIMRDNIENSLKFYKEIGVEQSGNTELLKSELEGISRILIISIPSIFVIGSFIGVLINYYMARYVAMKRYGLKVENGIRLKLWMIPDIMVWFLIASGALLMLPINFLFITGLNCLIILLTLYFFQGISVSIFLLDKWHVPPFLRIAVYMIIFFQPIFIFMITGFGLFDIWLDFRKIRSSHTDRLKTED